ncbi:carbohydrate ABC transporter membrane protein 1 (CUT1 family) [Paenibacillus cellulosilyticus]|uniref:Carbohydrate ABC transporter membrane protein 1 (CUT1 family) n=1 Tax=Paenibacillus cellulosilyticus TaxID=375489 RepID=A0A2V2YMQ3_9BACL|nr:sugar ABC transporter permease [Paenibacillus cellulosilyticus]PWV95848.1 carbohydrate ABC transporter membrane protein 1 (CUT1 family) [Paenibacillus cellulosilyticus]
MNNKTYPYYFSLGAMLLYVLLLVIPGVAGIAYAFTDWNSYDSAVHFIGLDNFRKVFSGENMYVSFIKNTLIFTIATIVLKTVIGFFLALLVNKGVRFRNFHRAVMFMPAVVPMLIVGLIFKSVLHPDTGLLNEFLLTIGLGFLAQHWLTDLNFAFKSIIGVDVWKGAGYIMVILLAGLQSIPKDYDEAAEIDGAGYWRRIWNITIPLLMPALTVTLVLNMLYGLKVFDTVYVLTNGGPGYATEVLFTGVFKEFSMGRYGLGTALSTVLFVFMTIIGYFVVKVMSREEDSH